ncbi:MAG: hypothetical protein HZB16_12475 [Armatimonadetes bacterium]|nr:hypothetical protein [Armatimonadota bacterium]
MGRNGPVIEEPDPRQVDIWRGMSGADRLHMASDLWVSVRDMVRRAELDREPGIDSAELNRRVAERMSRGT